MTDSLRAQSDDNLAKLRKLVDRMENPKELQRRWLLLCVAEGVHEPHSPPEGWPAARLTSELQQWLEDNDDDSDIYFQIFPFTDPMTYNNGNSNSNNGNGGDQKLRLCGLWRNTPKNGGESYLSGTIGGIKVLIFKNGYKNGDDSKEPDFNVYLAPNQQKEGKAPQQRQPETDLF